MRSTLLYDLAAAATAALVAIGVGTAVHRYHLENGLTVVLAPHRLAPVVALQAWIGVGSADEPIRRAGIAHVFEHMLFKGTERRGVGEIVRAVEGAGGDINAWTAFDQTVFHVVLASRYFDTGLDVLGDAIESSSFAPEELEREREVILEEIKQGQDDPARVAAQGLFATAFERHPYGRPVIGEASSVRSIRRHHLLEFHRRWYVGGNIALVVAGDFDEVRARRRIEAHFGSLPAGTVPRRRRREPRQQEPRARVVAREAGEAHLAIGFHATELAAEDTPALDVAAIVLGQGESSRLSTAVRRKAELVIGIHAYLHGLRDPGLFVVGATLPPENLETAVEAISAETQRLVHEPISAAELEKARHAIEADAVFQRETVEGIARKYGFFEQTAGDAGFEERYVERVRRVTADDVRAAAARYLAPGSASLSAVVPAAGKSGGGAKGRATGPLLAALRRGASRAARRSAAPVAVARASDPDLVREELASGVRVVVKRDPSVPVVAARAAWTGGLRFETEELNGINNLLAETITRGCGSRSSEEVIRTIDEMAAALSGFSGRNSFGLRAEWLAEDWEKGFDLLADCVLAPRFERDEVARERRRVLDEIDARRQSPSFLAFRLFAETLYQAHPYRFDSLGARDSVAELTRAKLVDYYRRTYPVSELTIAVVGDVDPARVLARAREIFGKLPRRGRRAPKVPRERFAARPAKEREVYRYLERDQAHLIVGFPGTTIDDPDRHALEVLTTVLGGQGGRLFLELRDRQALAYRVGAYSLEGVDPGYVAVYIACSPEKMPSAVAGIRRELERIASDGVKKIEVERAARYLVGTHEISLQRRSSLASALAFHEAYGLGYEEYQRYPKAIAAVTPEEVRRVAASYFDWDLAVIATVQPEAMSPEAARRARGVRRAPPKRAPVKRAPAPRKGGR